MNPSTDSADEIRERFGDAVLMQQQTRDNIPTIWCAADKILVVLRYLKEQVARPYAMLYDLTAIDERRRARQSGLPSCDFTVVYHLTSYKRNEDIRIKVPLTGNHPSMDSITAFWPAADWYEREIWDMFGITFSGHPHLRRILMPLSWIGHPLRKEHPSRATEMGPFTLPLEKEMSEEEALRFRPSDWGLKGGLEDTDYMFLNLGPQHPGTHGLIRIALQLDGEEIVDAIPEIGFHHRGAEKMGERQTWHTYIPYTDRIDYLGGVMNNLAYVLAVEKLAGIVVPERVNVIRILLSELFRAANHLVWLGTFVSDIGAMSPVFFTFSDREHIFEIITAITGGRMHPSWFRIGGVAQDLPNGWDKLVRRFLDFLPPRLKEYHKLIMGNLIFKVRTKGVGAYTIKDAMDWGVTGPGLRACGLEWDMRKKRPYSGYEQFKFDIPTEEKGDCYARAQVRLEEIRQSLRIIEQCLNNMPEGPYKADHPLTTPPPKDRTLRDIDTLIPHFLGVGWGPVIPEGEACVPIEATKGVNSYYLISEGDIHAYRVRIRTPSFPHLQMVPSITRGLLVPDLLAILGSIDYVLADVDR
ncbi:MAG: NADH-quinone oxidoreductase subunit C/D [Desulfobacteraceae bacterium]|jgi:NADH-quinone oxidoreductase subunit C/D